MSEEIQAGELSEAREANARRPRFKYQGTSLGHET